jgi:hypothetical protein
VLFDSNAAFPNLYQAVLPISQDQLSSTVPIEAVAEVRLFTPHI